MSNDKKIIWTIGHSTRSLNDFISMLNSFDIELLADIRSFPGSRRYPHFNKSQLKNSLENSGFQYIHFPDLGGRRKPRADSKNTAWRQSAFRGYADYMESAEFRTAIENLENAAIGKRTAFMCAEAVWWHCHRSLVSDYLKNRDWSVIHIMDLDKGDEHPYTSAARIEQGQLFYNTK